MIGITLSAEQIRTAPVEVRQWIERQVGSALGLQNAAAQVEPRQEHLAACSAQEVAAILSQIQGVLPAVNVFFEFGRHGVPVPQTRLQAYRLIDIAHHTRLQNTGQVVACLDIINQALGRIRSSESATFCAFDQEGHCFVAVETQQNIFQLWQSVVAGQQLAVGDPAASAVPPVAVEAGNFPPDGGQAPSHLGAN